VSVPPESIALDLPTAEYVSVVTSLTSFHRLPALQASLA
jgi:hypothetical protein